jgi:hypothetical protein
MHRGAFTAAYGLALTSSPVKPHSPINVGSFLYVCGMCYVATEWLPVVGKTAAPPSSVARKLHKGQSRSKYLSGAASRAGVCFGRGIGT